ncbi:MAG: flagellar assembly protein H [Cyanobacteria bacterium J06633_8]
MSRTPFDQFAKQFFEEFLTPLGEVKTNFEVPGEPKFIDIWFSPSNQPSVNPEDLGILGKFTILPCLFEPFRNQPNSSELRSCLYKLIHVIADFERQAKREEKIVSEDELPQLWIITPSASDDLLKKFNAFESEDWLEGMYFFGEGLKTAIIAINKLPRTPETLWLRIFGKGIIQQQAIDEVIGFDVEDPRRSTILQLLATWKISIEASSLVEQEDRELIMQLSQAYLEWEQKTERRGIEQGMEQGQRQVVENLLKARFGELDEQLLAIIEPMLQLPPQEYASLLLELSSLQREELLERFAA